MTTGLSFLGELSLLQSRSDYDTFFKSHTRTACLHTPKNEHTGFTPTHTDTHSLWVWLSCILSISHE